MDHLNTLIEAHIRQARLARSKALGDLFAHGWQKLVRFLISLQKPRKPAGLSIARSPVLIGRHYLP